MKVTRKKSYNVAMFQGAGPPPPPIHYLLRRPCAGQSACSKRLVGRGAQPMGVPAALPHVAAAPASGPTPVPVAKGNAAGAELELQKPAPTPPPALGAIHKARCPQQRASSPVRPETPAESSAA